MCLIQLVSVAVVASVLVTDIILRYLVVRRGQPLNKVADWEKALPCPVVAALSAISLVFIGWPAIPLLIVSAFASVDLFKTSLGPARPEDVPKFDRTQAAYSSLIAALFFGFELIVASLLLRSLYSSAVAFATQ